MTLHRLQVGVEGRMVSWRDSSRLRNPDRDMLVKNVYEMLEEIVCLGHP